VLEGPQDAVEALSARITVNARHDAVRVDDAGPAATRLFGKWAMAKVAEHHEPDMPMVATTGGLAQGAPGKVTPPQDAILTRLRDLTRGYGQGS
jgi:Sensors of blue-light using FAD